jgi:peroxiredoxin Q/BCP
MELSQGDKAPTFTLASTQGEVSLDDLKGQWVVLYFYPKDDTPGCTVEACDFRDALPNMNAKVLGVSADDVSSHEKFRDKFSLPFPLLADEGGKVSEAYGTYGEKKMYGKTFMGVFRSTFIIDPDGNIAEAMYKVKHDGHVAEVASKLTALQASG